MMSADLLGFQDVHELSGSDIFQNHQVAVKQSRCARCSVEENKTDECRPKEEHAAQARKTIYTHSRDRKQKQSASRNE